MDFGNNGGTAIVTQEGGTFNVLGGASGLAVGRQGATGSLTLSGGLFNEEDAAGTTFGLDSGGSGTGTLTLSGGTFEESASNVLTFNTPSSYINFTTGSKSVLSLFEASTSDLDGLVTAGDIEVGDTVDTNTSDFAIAGSSSGQGTLQLVPEPSAWALMLGGLGGLMFIRRKRFSTV